MGEVLDVLSNDINSGISTVGSLINENPVASSAIALGTGATVGAGSAIIASGVIKKRKKKAKKAKKKSTRKKKSSRKKSKSKRTSRRKSRRGSSTRTNTSRSKIYYTKGRHQPYIILSNGRARFIKRSSAIRMKHTKGGYK